MKNKPLQKILNLIIPAVWLINGLICKVLNVIPRHQQIVDEILGQDHSRLITILIGISEIFMAVWIWTKYKTKISAILQIAIVAIMNLIEFIMVPELLLWGKLNSFFAFLFICVVWFNEFILNKNDVKKSMQ